LGFPLSLSETFQRRNTNKTIAEALTELNRLQDICLQKNKILVTYLSMGFGNPYQDPWNAGTVLAFVQQLAALDIRIISLADTVGVAQPGDITYLFRNLIPAFPQIEFGAHLHVQPQNWQEKVAAAFTAGCTRFDGALRGFGGCPMATNMLTGNLATENLVAYFQNNAVPLNLNQQAFEAALARANEVFI
jgi:hydroxymethylglutaryl-CoA lyase